MESNSIIYEFNTKDDLVFEKGKWKIKHKSTKIIQNTYIILLSFIEFHSKEIYNIELSCQLDNTLCDFKRLEGTNFEVRINKVILNFDISQTLIIEIKNKENMDLSCNQCKVHKIKYTYFDDNSKSFCSLSCLNLFFGPKRDRDDNDDDEEPEAKKRKIIPLIDVLFIGLDHSQNEELLDNNLINSLNKFSDIFNNDKIFVKQRNDQYNITNRKPFLMFWENTNIQNNSIETSNLSGRDSLSWKLPAESESITCFQYLETAFYLFLFPVNFNNEKEPEHLIFNQNNEKAIKIQRSLLRSHGTGFDSLNPKKFGLINPFALRIGMHFIKNLIDAMILNGEDNLEYLEIIIPNKIQCKQLIKNIWDFNDFVIETEREKSYIKDLINERINHIIFKFGGNYNQLYDLLFPEKTNDHNNQIFLMIYYEGDFSIYYDQIKKLISETWTMIASNVNPQLFKYINPGHLNIILNENNDYNIKTIDLKYFTEVIIKLKNELTIDIPTLIYYHTVLLFSDGILSMDQKILNNETPFLHLRDLIFFQNMTNICLTTNIKRCIILYGNGHKDHIKEMLSIQHNINYNMSYYYIYNVENYKLFSDDVYNQFSSETKIFIDELRNKIVLYIIYERIDQWLWETEQFKEKVSLKNSTGKKFIFNPLTIENEEFRDDKNLISKFGSEKYKLQMFSDLIDYYKSNRPDDMDIHYYIIGLYIYFIITTGSPVYDNTINNYYKDYISASMVSIEFRYFLKNIHKKDIFLSDLNNIFIQRNIGESVSFVNFDIFTVLHDKNIYDLIYELWSKKI
jgi:hypothetical protein